MCCNHAHLIGIGGVGMAPLAKILLDIGWSVSGSDLQCSETTAFLEQVGARIAIGHSPDQVQGATHVVYSSAIRSENSELASARQRGLRLLHRSEMLGQLLRARRPVAVGGAHGKTTVTSMIATVLERDGWDPLVMIGAACFPFGLGAKAGGGEYAVIEADESDRSFLNYHPEYAVITSIEPDHLENYDGAFSELVRTYEEFLSTVRPGGTAVLGIDDPLVHRLSQGRHAARTLSYGFSEACDWRAEICSIERNEVVFLASYQAKPVGKCRLVVPGRHNVANALAALAVTTDMGVSHEAAFAGLEEFRGARRRFELVGKARDITVVDDYAHHPTEISATLRAAAEGWHQRIVAVFQPHRYSRTKFLMDDFAAAFDRADIVVITDIYAPSSEEAIPGVSASCLAERVKRHGKAVVFIPKQADIVAFLLDTVNPGDMVITMGAGSIGNTAQELAAALN